MTLKACSVCGEQHPISDIELSCRRPDAILAFSFEERESRVKENDDLCIIDGERFFVRGLVALPVLEREQPYALGVWAEIDQIAFDRIVELWSDPNQGKEPAMQGVLANRVPSLPSTLGVGVIVKLSDPETRPHFVVTDDGHPLFEEQSSGIPEHRVHEYNSFVL